MPRKLSILAFGDLVIAVVEVLTLGKSPTVPCSETRCNDCLPGAVTMCLRARAAGTVSLIHFGVLMAAGIGVWAAGNIGWTYYEVVLLREPPNSHS